MWGGGTREHEVPGNLVPQQMRNPLCPRTYVLQVTNYGDSNPFESN